MYFLHAGRGEVVEVYLMQRKVGEKWRLVYVDKSLMFSGGVFEDLNWEEKSLWYPFSVRGQGYRKTGLPGALSLEEALKAYNYLKVQLDDGAALRLKRYRIRVESELIDSTEEGDDGGVAVAKEEWEDVF